MGVTETQNKMCLHIRHLMTPLIETTHKNHISRRPAPTSLTAEIERGKSSGGGKGKAGGYRRTCMERFAFSSRLHSRDVITVGQSLAHMHMMSAVMVHAGLYDMGVNATCNAGAEEIERLPKPSGAARAAWLAQKEKYNIEDADPERRRARLERKMRRHEEKVARRRTRERGPACAAASDDSSL